MLQFNRKAVWPILIMLIGVAAIFYWRVNSETTPGDYLVKTGNYRLEDGQLEEAVKEFSGALEVNPQHVFAHLGLAITYMQMGENARALSEFDRTIELAPELAAAYANRGILHDRLGEYQTALNDYKKALTIDAEVLDGPGFLWRFMRNIDKPPPTIYERAVYLQTELEKPPAERVLKVPELDDQQRMFKKDAN